MVRRHLSDVLALASLPAHAAEGVAANAAADIQDIRGPVPVDGLPPFALTGGALLLAGAWLLARRPARGRATHAVPAAEEVRDEAATELARMIEEHRQGVCPGDVLILRLDALLRGALLDAMGVPARHLTSTELRHRLAGDGRASGQVRIALDRFLSLADRVKFAGHRPEAGELESALGLAAELLGALSPVRAP